MDTTRNTPTTVSLAGQDLSAYVVGGWQGGLSNAPVGLLPQEQASMAAALFPKLFPRLDVSFLGRHTRFLCKGQIGRHCMFGSTEREVDIHAPVFAVYLWPDQDWLCDARLDRSSKHGVEFNQPVGENATRRHWYDQVIVNGYATFHDPADTLADDREWHRWIRVRLVSRFRGVLPSRIKDAAQRIREWGALPALIAEAHWQEVKTLVDPLLVAIHDDVVYLVDCFNCTSMEDQVLEQFDPDKV